MNTRIVADGARRLRESPEMQAKLREMWVNIQARHTAELARASFIKRHLLRWRMAAEYWRERRRILPSAQSLYVSNVIMENTSKSPNHAPAVD